MVASTGAVGDRVKSKYISHSLGIPEPYIAHIAIMTMEVVAAWADFEIPFLIQVEDSLDGSDNAFQVTKDGITAELRFEKRAETSDIHGGKIFGLVEGERLGNVSHTVVRVGFAEPYIDSLGEEYKTGYEDIAEGNRQVLSSNLDTIRGKVANDAVEWTNLFLEKYRATFGYYWIRRLKPSEIAHFKLTFVAENGEEYTEGMMYAQDGLTPGSTTLNDEQRTVLQSRLTDQQSVPTTLSLKLDAKDKLDIGEYRLAVLLAGTMFESFLKTSLREVMEAEGRSKEYIENALKNDDGDYKSVVSLAKDCHKTFHFGLEESDEYEDWYENTRALRNDVIHEGYQPSEMEARLAIESAEAAVNELAEKIGDRVQKLE